MTLYAAADRKGLVKTVPHRLLLDGWKSRLEPLELQAIDVELDRLIRGKPSGEIRTAAWLPTGLSPYGRLCWDGTPLTRIWEKACQRDAKQACWCFGLLLWEHMMTRPDEWRVERADLGDIPLAGTTFRRSRVKDGTGAPRPLAASIG